MKKKETEFHQIDRKYIITSAELKSRLGLVGEVITLNLWSGRSPNDIEQGKSADKDEWEIHTREVRE